MPPGIAVALSRGMLHTSSLRLASRSRVLPLALALCGAAACNSVETGANGLVQFTPDDCGRAWCDLDDRLALGGLTDVSLDGVDGASVSDLHVETSAPWIADVVADAGTFEPRATIEGTGLGFVDLLAVDDWGYVVDFYTIEVAAPDELAVDVIGAAVDGPHPAEGVDDLYFVGADSRITIDVSALADGSELMGRLGYSVFLDQAMFAAVEPGDDITDGHFALRAPAGEHTVTIVSTTASRTIHLSAN